ncbi:MAG: glycosyltransferase [Pseudomonadota bacterium]
MSKAAQDGTARKRPEQRPAVSVIVPVHNVVGHVAAAIESLQAQTFEDFEAIVVDDGSTDLSGDVVLRMTGDDPRFLLLRQENAGLSAARNAGLKRARAPVIGFLDSDDRFAPEFLETLHRVLEKSGAPWVACAVGIETPDAPHVASAIHGVAHPAAKDPWELMRLDAWPEIARHWPSAWNKLYRRELIDGASFPEGLAFEDHTWFHRAANRAPVIAYVPRPLYLHTRGRTGQITAEDSERVFQQFEVLDRVHAQLKGSFKPEAAQGFARIATRTLHERLATVRDKDRRDRFVAVIRDYLAAHDMRWTPDWDRAISHSFADVLQGRLPLTVVIATDGNGPGLERSLWSVASQYLADLEVLIVPTQPGHDTLDRLYAVAAAFPRARVLDGGVGSVSEARNRGLDAATGLFTVFLDAGDWYGPGALWLGVEALLRENADFGVMRFAKGHGDLHPGTHDGRDPFGDRWPAETGPRDRDWLELLEGRARRIPPQRVPLLHAHPSAKIFRTAFLRAAGVYFPEEPLSAWAVTLHAAFAAPRSVAIAPVGVFLSDSPIDRRLWRRKAAPEALHDALMDLAPMLDAHLPRDDWYPRLLARALWEKARFADFPTGEAKIAFLQEARAMVQRTCPDISPEGRVDPYIDQGIRDLFPAFMPIPG